MNVKYFDLINKKVFISGGADGIGSSIVENFCEQGAEVIFVDINAIKANELIKNIKNKKFNLPKFFKCNVLDIKKLQNIIHKNGPFDVLGPVILAIGPDTFNEPSPPLILLGSISFLLLFA